jgi:hypothetical protein
MTLDWIAAIFALIGMYLIGRKNRAGFFFCLASGITWIIVAIQTNVLGLFLEVTPLIFLNVWNYKKWGKKK